MSVWLPRWPIDRWRRENARPGPSARPLVLATAAAGRRVVTAADAAAEAEGIGRGMPLADARALRPDLAVAEAAPAADAAALAGLAAWCRRWSPWTAPDGMDGVLIDITGCAHLRGGEAALVQEVVARLGGMGIAGRAAIADTPGAAWAVARHGEAAARVVPPGGQRAALASLPVQGLRLDPLLTAALLRLGLRRIGDIAVLPRAALARRFGAIVAERLDQALGAVPEPLSPMPPPPRHWTRQHFAEPIATAEAIAAAARGLLEGLCRRLAAAGLGARRLELVLYRVDGTAASAAIGTARPSRDPRHLLRLLEERLGEVDPGLGIEDAVLAAPLAEALAAAQLPLLREGSILAPGGDAGGDGERAGPAARSKLLQTSGLPDPALRRLARALLQAEGKGRGDGEDEAELALLVDRLANRLGPEALGCLLPRESHEPERAVQFVPSTVDCRNWRIGPLAPASPKGEGELLRPVRLLPRPEPIEAVAPVPDDPPVLFRWRRVAHRVRRADGPERIAGEWWHRPQAATEARDYYRVEDEAGRRFWLYRAGLYRPETRQRWFLHGIFA